MTDSSNLFQSRKNYWEKAWASDDYSPGWLDRGIAPELITHHHNGWLPASGRVLDIGCGKGDTAAWFASQGYDALGFDIAQSAIDKAIQKHGDIQGKLALQVLDICQQSIPGETYNIIIDRGCLHQIPPAGIKHYIHHVNQAASHNAKLILFSAAYRNNKKIMGHDEERQEKIAFITRAFKDIFILEKTSDTFLDKDYGKGPSQPLSGIIFWLSKCK